LFEETDAVKTAVTGEALRTGAFTRRVNAEITVDDAVLHDATRAAAYDVIVDLNADERSVSPAYFSAPDHALLILGAVKRSITQLIHDAGIKVICHVAGMNTLPWFIENPRWEISFGRNADKGPFEKWAQEMKTDFLEVRDRVGMITPRVVCMIINEACYTLMEGTATQEDIDKGMKLGTNYPWGPFEWCDRIGIKDVYETLEAVWDDTHDPRYKICPLLKTKYLKGESFYQSSAG
jgi:3-hydroxybutyryl-CoA dehydrogenase